MMNTPIAWSKKALRLLAFAAVVCASSVWPTGGASAQGAEMDRARGHLDAARAAIPEKPLLTKATRWADLAELEVDADRPEKAREIGYFLMGVLQEEPARPDDYIHLIAKALLAQDKTQDAINALGRVSKPSITTRSLYLDAVHQTTRRFGLQRGVVLAREAFPGAMDRRSVYCKLCYTLTENGQAKTADEFIAITFDLFEIFIKLDAYRYAAVGMHRAGDTLGAVAMLDNTLDRVGSYRVATTRVQMYCDLAETYEEIGQRERAKTMLQRAMGSLGQVKPDDFGREGLQRDVAVGWAQLGERDQAMGLAQTITTKHTQRDVYEAVIQYDLRVGQIDRAKALNDQHRVLTPAEFELQVAMGTLKRGDANAALQRFITLTEDFAPDRWHREVARELAKQGQHIAIQALLAKLKDADDRYQFHIGAAEGYLDKR